MTRFTGLVIASIAAAAIKDQPAVTSGSEPLALVREIPVDTLRDVAVAIYDSRHPVIYYNPTMFRRLGPQLSAFFLAHERGHIRFRHTRANALLAGISSRDSLLQSRELEADCYATETLATTNRPAVDAATRFFSRMGGFRFDHEHPSGARRAAEILSCLPVTKTEPLGPRSSR